MKEILIEIDGKSYPARETMGAMLRFKRETGKEATDIDGGSLSELATYMWCCVASACKHDKVEFPYSLEDFCDSADLGTMETWAGALASTREKGGTAEDEKKRAQV